MVSPGGAIRSWQAALGLSHVVADGDELRLASSATHVGTTAVLAVLRPGSREEVQECVRIAVRYGVGLHPVSGGTNWGYGSSVPFRDGCAVLDLARLDRIVRVDPDLAYAVVEPGVSFRALADHLAEHAPGLVASVTGASPAGSVIGNALERGVGSGPLADRAETLLDLEVVTGTGALLHTGAERWGRSGVLRPPAGPDLRGLLFQAGTGVVTRASVLLARRPAAVAAVQLDVAAGDHLAVAVDALRDLAVSGVLRAPVTWWNDVRVMAHRASYPWRAAGGTTPLPEHVRSAARAQLGIGAYRATVVLGAPSAAHLAADLALVGERLGRDAVPHTVLDDPATGAALRRSPALGRPDGRNLGAAYWRKPMPVPADPDPARDRCGVLWLDVAFPHRGADVAAAAAVVERVVPGHGLDPMLVVVNPTPRTALVVPMLAFDLDEPGEGERAERCLGALHDALGELGGVVTRADPVVARRLPAPGDDTATVAAGVAAVLDPHDVISPGRYSG